MELIFHRRNTIAELNDVPVQYGIEVDIRSYGEKLVVHHDPFVTGESFEEWLSAYRHGTLILNVKEEGLEIRLINLMQRAAIENYFFLDQSFPFLVKYSRLGMHRSAVRVSEFESIETAFSFAGKVDWVWVDHFSRFPLSQFDVQKLRGIGFKLCLASPELCGLNAEVEIQKLAQLLWEQNIKFDAICTKRPDLWNRFTYL